jgi:hypothetical protein
MCSLLEAVLIGHLLLDNMPNKLDKLVAEEPFSIFLIIILKDLLEKGSFFHCY